MKRIFLILTLTTGVAWGSSYPSVIPFVIPTALPQAIPTPAGANLFYGWDLDGSDFGLVTGATHSGATDVYVSCWLKPTLNNSFIWSHTETDSASSDNTGIQFGYLSNGRYNFTIGGVSASTGLTPLSGQADLWTFVAFFYDASAGRVFYNAFLQSGSWISGSGAWSDFANNAAWVDAATANDIEHVGAGITAAGGATAGINAEIVNFRVDITGSPMPTDLLAASLANPIDGGAAELFASFRPSIGTQVPAAQTARDETVNGHTIQRGATSVASTDDPTWTTAYIEITSTGPKR